jgi:hypothetical protein
VLIAAGHGDAEVKTKTEVDGKDTKSKVKIDKTSVPQLRVVSMKPTGEACSVN